MKRNIFKSLLLTFFVAFVGFTAFAQGYKMPEPTFEVQFNSSNFVLGEQIYVVFTARLLPGENKPNFFHESLITVRLADSVREYGVLEPTLAPPQPLPQPFRSVINSDQKNQLVVHKVQNILRRSNEYFAAPGNYEVKFTLRRPSRPDIFSNWISVSIGEPLGFDKRAFDFLSKYENGTSFDWVWLDESEIDKLEEFVNAFHGTAYWDFAVLRLGDVYKLRGEFERAKGEYEKLGSSKNSYITGTAGQKLAEIEKRIAENNKRP